MKWIALALVVLGIVAVVVASKLDDKASFDDGSFVGTILLGMAGSVSVVSGVIWLAVLFFMEL
jgi:hypothetical protein